MLECCIMITRMTTAFVYFLASSSNNTTLHQGTPSLELGDDGWYRFSCMLPSGASAKAWYTTYYWALIVISFSTTLIFAWISW